MNQGTVNILSFSCVAHFSACIMMQHGSNAVLVRTMQKLRMYNRRYSVQNIFRNIYIILCLVATLLASAAYSQNKQDSITASFHYYQQHNIKEKMFVHTDKSYYLCGEIIWFRLYNADAAFHRPLQLSTVAYAELLDSTNKPVLRAKIALQKGAGNGSFYIPLSVPSGSYRLRTYTNWMKNFDPGYYFEKFITVVNTQRTTAVTTAPAKPVYDIQFFPEGGNLVAGLQSKVAFKAVDQYAKGIVFTAALLDNNDTMLKFQPVHAGMGTFSFTPQNNHAYKAVITLPGGGVIIKDIPQAYRKGYVMSLEEGIDNTIQINVQSANTPPGEVFLFIHTNEVVKSVQSSAMQNGSTVFMINKSSLGDGISHLTIFDQHKQPVCERLYFKKPAQGLQVNINTDKQVYATRSKVNLDIGVSHKGYKADTASLSMSVFRTDSLQSANEATIETYLLLGSVLKGPIEDPGYYFKDSSNTALADYLVLTNGWRRFNWKNILKNEKPVFSFVPECNGHIITGKIINTQTGKGQDYIESYLSVPGTRLQFYPSSSDSNGVVKFEMKDFYGSSEIFVRAGTLSDSIHRLDILDPFSNSFSATPAPAFLLPESSPNTLNERSIGMQVQNIYTGNKLARFVFPAIDTASFFLKADKTYLLDDYTRFTTLEEVLREYVTWVFVTKKEGKYHFPVFDISNDQMFTGEPLNLLDGVPVFNLNAFLDTDPLQIRKLDVINRRYMLGGSSFNGILNWTTYKGDLANYKPDTYTVALDYEALQLQREFYSPEYNNEEQLNSRLPDFRNVLQWQPEIKIGNGGNQKHPFFTSDLPGTYAVIVQGITPNGIFGSSTTFFTVK